MSEELLNTDIEMIAIVGMACHFPGASDIDTFWQNLKRGVESISNFSDDELLAAGVAPDLLTNPHYVKARGRLPGHDLFDAGFFGFTPSEAAITDPQHRLFLECAWEAMEHAGYDPRRSGEGTGVFAGAGLNTYALRNIMANPDLLKREGEYRILIGNDKDFVATRTSYKLDLKGPSLNISTACSTSLVAVHYGCSSLLAYQCDMALAGAVSIYTPQNQGYMYEPGGILSADGHCRPFSADAGGTVGSAGVGIVVLKRLSEALADGDTIHAVIRGSAVNNDGADKIGFTAPSVEGQAQVIVEAQAVADVAPESIGYIEAHGTGTPMGDPIELAALTRAFSHQKKGNDRCYLGSVKSNFGHCDTAAGMAGLIKTVLALKHKTIPPTLHCESTNPEMDFTNSPFRVNTELLSWERGESPRRAGVSSFGVGGTNAHVILEEAETLQSSSSVRPWFLLPISARTGSALDTAALRLAEFLKAEPAVNLEDVAFTLQVGRSGFTHRRTIICNDRESAIAALQNQDFLENEKYGQDINDRQVAFLFSGQGTQYVGMGRTLYQTEPLFRAEIDHCAEILEPLLGRDIRHILFPDEQGRSAAKSLMSQTSWAQPALFVLEYCLARLMIGLNVTPKACIGHSLGEYVAACIAGVFTLKDCLQVIVRRGQLMQEMAKGAMLSVSVSPNEIPVDLPENISIAAINTSRSCVLSGSFSDIDMVEEKLAGLDIPIKRLHTSHAFHSSMMNPAIETFIKEVDKLQLSSPNIRVISNLTGTWLTDEQAIDPDYWGQHLLNTVRFSDGIETLFSDASYIAVEIGPGHTLATFARNHSLYNTGNVVCTTLAHVQKAKRDNGRSFSESLAHLWQSGVDIDWQALHGGENRKRIPLPTYPFERQRFFIEPAKRTGSNFEGNDQRTRKDQADWFYGHSWRRGFLPLQTQAPNSSKHWLIFADTFGYGRALGARLRDGGATVQYAFAADFDMVLPDDCSIIDPRNKGAYQDLLKGLANDGTFPDGIIYCWSLKPERHVSLKESIRADRVVYYDSLILLAQTLEQCKPGHPTLLTIVTTGMFRVLGNEHIEPAVSLIMGPVTVIPQEHPHIDCKVIDIEISRVGAQIDPEIVKPLMALCQNSVVDPVIALRGNQHWVRTFEPISLPSVSAVPRILRSGGVYLIVGGMGGIGLQLAEYLAGSVGARLVLISRNALPVNENSREQNERISLADEPECHDIDVDQEKIERDCNIQAIGKRGSLESRLNSLCAALVILFLRRSDINTKAGSSCNVGVIRQQLGIAPTFFKFFSFLLSTLVEEKHAQLVNGRIIFLDSASELEDPVSEAAALIEDFPDFAPLIRFLIHCVDNYPRALTSTAEAISILYPQGDATALKEIGQEIEEHTYHRVYCLLLASKIRKIIDEADGRPIRILEIGGGAGILTKHVMPLIISESVEYTFTDIGPSFVAKAREWAAQNGYHDMRFGTLDVSRDFSGQGYSAGQFDIIIELDVVHATRRIASTIDKLRQLLAPGGMLLMAESTKTARWTTMIYGLAEGWWLYEDTDLRSEGPLLGPDKWESVMSRAGFSEVRTYPTGGAKRVEHDCCLIVGKAPDDIRFDKLAGASSEVLSQNISRLETLGAIVKTYAADISNLEQMKNVIEGVEGEFGEIHGVIHSAAIENRGAVQLKTVGEEGPEFGAKVNGTLVLDELFENRTLDFMIICSSITSILGGVGDVEYTAVNAFADAFAQANSKVKSDPDRYTIAIDWDRWIGTGMAATFEKRFKALSGNSPTGGMSPVEGRDAFSRILANPYDSQIVVSTRSFNDWVSEARQGTSERIADSVPVPVTVQARHDLPSAYVAPESDTQKLVASVWQDVLGIDRIGVNDVFSEIGGDSLIAIKVVARLSEACNVNINVSALFEDPTVARFSERIEALRAVALENENRSEEFFEMGETGIL